MKEEDRAAIAQVKEILENEHKGITFTMMDVIRTVLYFFIDSKKKPTKK
jgi:hypothetical protein